MISFNFLKTISDTVVGFTFRMTISNVAPADAPLHLLPLPKAGGDPEIYENNSAVDVRIHDYINNLQFSISPNLLMHA